MPLRHAVASSCAHWRNDGTIHRPRLQTVPQGGHETVLKGRSLPDKEVRHRAAALSCRPGGPGSAPKTVRIRAPAARETEGPQDLRGSREPVPENLQRG